METFMRFMADWGAWDILGIIITIVPTILIVVFLFPRKMINNLYIDTKITSVNTSYPKVIGVEIRNHTNEPIYILSCGFKFKDKIKPSPIGAKNSATGLYEIKFQGRNTGTLSDIDTLVRPNQIVTTWIPIDPEESNESIGAAMKVNEVGILKLKCQKISSRPHPFTNLRIPI